MERDKLFSHGVNLSSMDQTSTLPLDRDGRNEDSASTSTFYYDNLTTGDHNLKDDIEVVKPYDIEEPEEEEEEEEEPVPTRARFFLTQGQENHPEIWQGDLVDSMEGLHCDSDYSGARINLASRRGKKRKSSRPTLQSSPKSLFDLQYEGPRLSPNKRRRNKSSRENLKPSQTSFRSRGCSGSSGSSISTDTSTTNITNGSTAPEQMDID